MRLNHGTLLIAVLAVGNVFAQKSNPPVVSSAHAIAVIVWHTGGLCGGSGYCDSSETITPKLIVSQLTDSPNPKKFPNRKVRRVITNHEWDNLQSAIDSKSLKGLPEERCRAAIDLPCSGVKIQFSDGSKINLIYNSMNPPAPVSKLLAHIPNNPIYFTPK